MRLMKHMIAAGLALSLGAGAAAPSIAQESFITVASTTSTEASGLFDHILPVFEEATDAR